MEGCACGQATVRLRFGSSLVTACTACHRLAVAPVVDPRMPGFAEQVKALQEEVRAEEEEQTRNEVSCAVDEAAARPEGGQVKVQVTTGNPRGLSPGSMVEGWLEGEEEPANVEVLQRAGAVLELLADDRAWGHLRKGTTLRLRPSSNATLYRNLLKAFLAVKRRHSSYTDLEHAGGLPRLVTRAVAGLDESGLRPAQALALRASQNLGEGGLLLIQGPPGTGKTTVIARILKEEVRRGRTVLVTSHTHVAIDNAIRKALAATPALVPKVVRLGDSSRVASDLAHLRKRVGEFRADPEDPEARPLFAKLQETPIVAMTLDALAAAVLAADMDNQEIPPFDTVVVDEAGMNAVPKTAIAHFVAKRLILVGDPLQLPPIVRSRRFSQDENHKRSHFELLQMLRPDLCVLLDEQFRSQPDIYEWSRDAIYGGRVTSHAASKPIPIGKLLGQQVTSRVLWVDTGALPGNKSEQVGSSRSNPTHTALAIRIAQELLKQGIAPGDMGYIAPFRAQAEAFTDAVAAGKSKTAHLGRITAATVDAFQGNERRVILFDLTTMHPAKPHEDHRRLNVSLTRPQELLILIGNRAMVKSPQENPFLWSLQNWKAAQILAAPMTA